MDLPTILMSQLSRRQRVIMPPRPRPSTVPKKPKKLQKKTQILLRVPALMPRPLMLQPPMLSKLLEKFWMLLTIWKPTTINLNLQMMPLLRLNGEPSMPSSRLMMILLKRIIFSRERIETWLLPLPPKLLLPRPQRRLLLLPLSGCHVPPLISQP